jgi:hypothetical protein
LEIEALRGEKNCAEHEDLAGKQSNSKLGSQGGKQCASAFKTLGRERYISESEI